MKKLGFPLLLIGIVGLMIGVFIIGNRKGTSSQDTASQKAANTIEGLKEFGKLDRNHTEEAVAYNQSPPAGGNHNPVWLACDGKVYDQIVSNEQAVHSLEHGAVWITYKPELSQEQINKLKQKVSGKSHAFMSPYNGLSNPVVLTAWGLQLGVESADDSRIDQFMSKYIQGPQTPEPGATCSAPTQDHTD